MSKLEIAVKIIIALILAVAIFYSSYLTSNLYKSIAAVIGGVLAFSGDHIIDFIKSTSKKKQRNKIIENQLRSLNKVLEKFTDKKIDTNRINSYANSEDTDYEKIDLYELLLGLKP